MDGLNGFQIHTALSNLCKTNNIVDIKTAQYLYRLRRYDLWRDTTGGIDTWEDYLKQPEINIPKSKANQLIRIYEYFGVKNKGWDTNDVPLYVLDIISKKNPPSSVITEMLEAGKTLSKSDFKERFHDLVNGTPEQDAVRTYSYIIMKKCNETGNITKVHDIDSDDIKNKFNLN